MRTWHTVTPCEVLGQAGEGVQHGAGAAVVAPGMVLCAVPGVLPSLAVLWCCLALVPCLVWCPVGFCAQHSAWFGAAWLSASTLLPGAVLGLVPGMMQPSLVPCAAVPGSESGPVLPAAASASLPGLMPGLIPSLVSIAVPSLVPSSLLGLVPGSLPTAAVPAQCPVPHLAPCCSSAWLFAQSGTQFSGQFGARFGAWHSAQPRGLLGAQLLA